MSRKIHDATAAPGLEDDPFAYVEAADDNPFADLWGELTTEEKLKLLERATAEDPFGTTHLDDCLSGMRITPSPLTRYGRASAAYLRSCYSHEQDDDQQEILRLVAAYWLRKSRAHWLD
ncbi:hypothetical protein [Mesorhizobium sophorae]|uniref:hypothetical protein n=1 Tax=Mesorhizobium sophorae TaxID=1300294 RepID=UPI000BA31B9B|nr:hypothetical protein [Mesorhizobium sophorae]